MNIVTLISASCVRSDILAKLDEIPVCEQRQTSEWNFEK